MATFLPQGPWTDELNWNLYAEHTRETCVPFHLHVKRGCASTEVRDFPKFIELPAEIQLSIFRVCDSKVLFQLMRVSSYTRKEAKKLFWSCSETWYKIHADWLLAGGFPGHTDDSLEFLARVTHLEVHFEGEPLAHNAWEDGVQQWARRPPVHIRDQQIRKFWEILQRRLPCATNVVLSEGGDGNSAEDPVPLSSTPIAEQCPPHIRTLISCVRHVKGYPQRATRVLWRQDHPYSSQSPPAWKIIDSTWTRQSVMPPPRSFTGPVGTFSRAMYHMGLLFYKKFARRILLIQAVEAQHLLDDQRPCACPAPGCNLQFELPGQWAMHAVDAGHDYKLQPPDQRFKILFNEYDAKLAREEQDSRDALNKMRIEWGEEGSEQRKAAEQAFLTQLHEDQSYEHEKPPEESQIWRCYQRRMNEPVGPGADHVSDD
jgi:hypothetical protein